MNEPTGVFADTEGRLGVSENGNRRGTRFDPAASKPNGAPADGVLGQVNFTTAATIPTQSGVSSVLGLAVDAGGTVFICDGSSRRVLGSRNAATKASCAPADFVFGQADFDSASAGINNQSFITVFASAVNTAGRLYTTDLF